MNTRLKTAVFSFFVFQMQTFVAQQLSSVNLIHQQLSILNPANLGLDGKKAIFTNYRKQWVGLPNSPEEFYGIAEGDFWNKKMGLGLMLGTSNIGMMRRTNYALGYRYKIQLGGSHLLNFGVSGGIERSRIDFSRAIADSPQEIALLQQNQITTSAKFNTGAVYQFKKTTLGLNASFFLGNNGSYYNPVNQKFIATTRVPSYSFFVNHNFILSSRWRIQPSLILYSTQGLPFYADLNTMAVFNVSYFASIGYRQSNNLYLTVGYEFFNQFRLSYAFQRNFGKVANSFSNTHEIGIKFYLLSASSMQDKQPSNRRIDEIQEQIDIEEAKATELKTKVDSLETNLKLLNEQVEKIKANQISREEFETTLKNYKFSVDSTSSTDIKLSGYDVISDSEAANMVDDGFSSYYITLGAFRNIEKARELKKILKREMNLEVKLVSIESASKPMFIIVLPNSYEAIKVVTTDIIKFRKERKGEYVKFLNGEPWILKSKK
jgi:type IX secretion system PorP/SprF family membrane protein